MWAKRMRQDYTNKYKIAGIRLTPTTLGNDLAVGYDKKNDFEN